ncbi:MAG: hypothetical protein ACOYNL_10435 [Rickettsiales bacterium]
MPRKKHSFKGVLAQPIQIVCDEKANALERLQAYRNGQIAAMKKIHALCEHYGLDVNDINIHLQLTMRMADEFIPGFKIIEKSPAGRKPFWDEITLTLLSLQVQHELELDELCGTKSNITYVCGNLTKHWPWKQRPISAKTLQTRYSEAQNSILVQAAKELAFNMTKARLGDDTVEMKIAASSLRSSAIYTLQQMILSRKL